MSKLRILLTILLLNGFTAQAQKEYVVGLLIEVRTPDAEGLLQRMKAEIAAVVGEDAIISIPEAFILTDDFKIEKAQSNYSQLLESEVDLILAFGPLSSLVIAGQIEHMKPTILFGAVDTELSKIPTDLSGSGIDNLAFMVSSRSFREDLMEFQTLTGFSNVGIAIDEVYAQVSDLEPIFQTICSHLGVEHRTMTFATIDDLVNDLEGIDALYLSGGFFLSDSDINRLAAILIEKRIPSFTSTSVDDVKRGLMATNTADENLDQILRRIALTVESFVNGTPLSEIPVYLDERTELTLNIQTAKKVGVPIKFSQIKRTHFVGDPEKSTSEMRYDLLGVINQSLTKNLGIQASQKEILLNEQDVKSAKSNFLPYVSASGTGAHIDKNVASIGNPEFSATGDITLQQTIYSEGARAGIDINKNLLESQIENYNSEALDLIYTASSAYFNALAAKVNLRVQGQNLELTKKNLHISEENFESGKSGKADVLRFSSKLATAKQDVVEAVNTLESSFVTLNQVMNNPIGMEIDVEQAEIGEGVFSQYSYDGLTALLDDPTLSEPFVAFLVEQAMQNSPEIKSLNFNLDVIYRNINLYSKGRLVPTVGLQGNYNHTFDQWGSGSLDLDPAGFYNVGVSVSLPIFNQNLNNINRQNALIQEDQLNINTDNTKQAIEVNVYNAVLSMTNQISNIELSNVAERTASESLELAQVAYSSGSVNIIQLIDAQNNYISSKLAKANAEYFYLLSSMRLERTIGYYFLLHTEAENQGFMQAFIEFQNNYNGQR